MIVSATEPVLHAALERPARPFLIVDDDPDAHYLLKRQLTRLGVGVEVFSAGDGLEGVAHLERCVAGAEPLPSLLFLDVSMPRMDGFAMLQWLKERQLLGAMTVAMLSSTHAPADVVRAIGLGAHVYLTKWPAPDLLAQVVNSALRLARRKTGLVARRRVLVIDDSNFARRTTRRLFELNGFEVIEAADGPEGVALFQTHAPDLVVLDLVMSGGMYGHDVLLRLREIDRRVPVIICTADTQETTARRARAAGAAYVMNKPLSAEKIALALLEVA